MHKMKKLLLVTAVIAGGSLSVVGAADVKQKIEGYMNPKLSITIDGKKYDMKDANGNKIYPITYNDRTYLPVRNIAEVTGMGVEWDDKTQTVIIKSKATQSNKKALVSKASNTLSAGEIGSVTLGENLSTGYSWHFTIDNKDIVSMESEKTTNNSDLVGAGGQHTWNFKALKKGNAKIVFKNYRDFEGESRATETLEFNITVS